MHHCIELSGHEYLEDHAKNSKIQNPFNFLVDIKIKVTFLMNFLVVGIIMIIHLNKLMLIHLFEFICWIHNL